jgi:hypothetical protein
LCGVQVVRFDPANRPASLTFGHGDLKRARTCVDVVGTRPYWTAGSKRGRKRENHAQHA